MRSSKSRSRNKSNRQRSIGNIINRVFDSSGPEGKVRGTPQQIIEKYLQLGRDAQLSNDRVAEQNFLQHAEHYTRLLAEAQREQAREQEERQRSYSQGGQSNAQGGQQNGNGGQNSNGGQNGTGGQSSSGYRDRPDREMRAPVAEAPRFVEKNRIEETRAEGASGMMPDFFSLEDGGAGLVETPEMRHSDPPMPEQRSPRPHRAEPAPVAAPVAVSAPLAEASVAAAPADSPAADAAPKTPRVRTPRKPRSDKPAPAETPPEGTAAE